MAGRGEGQTLVADETAERTERGRGAMGRTEQSKIQVGGRERLREWVANPF